MPLYLYNTPAKKKEEFKPLNAGKVLIYSCGPTVYSHPHIGNFRSFLCADLLRRYLEYKGFRVTQIMNITDVGHMTTDDDLSAREGEDKIQAAARKEQKSPLEITRFYTQEFLELAKLLNIKPSDKYPLATEHIPEMIDMIKTLLREGYAYEVNGNVYFDISRFPDYGKLSGNPLEQLIAGARVEINSEKKSPLDFALWKQDPKHIMQWDSPWGRGFPGWHIECSAMSLKYLGERFDIHTGGEDNIFPHHECEIAQSEGALGHKVVNHWFHIKHLLVDNKKMSKSLGNFYTVRDVLDKGYSPLVLRYALLNTHYRQPLNFTLSSLDAAKNALQRLSDFRQIISEKVQEPLCSPDEQSRIMDTISEEHRLISTVQTKFDQAMDDDLNISEALAVVFDFIREANKQAISPAFARAISDLLDKFDALLGIDHKPETEIPPEIEVLIKERDEARRQKNYKRADEIREQLEIAGIVIEDKHDGIRIKRITLVDLGWDKQMQYDLIYYPETREAIAIGPIPRQHAGATGPKVTVTIPPNQLPKTKEELKRLLIKELEKGNH